ncbi:hypothetical protein ACQY0O_007710 [Thecaphora frezii]|nr:putative transcription factor [Thecaphora frezii]
MSNHLSPAATSDHSSYAASSSNTGASPSLSHRSLATTVNSSSPSPSSRVNGPDLDAGEPDRPKPIICRWDNCGRIYYDPEVVYKHLCDDHVGRKSTNNLCLTCRWEGCDVSCAKRDHITSHLRVHTPLKPHSCDICNKTFKRPQDLKKHERIHTEQHQQQRQHKAAQNAAAKSYGGLPSDSTAFGTYHLAAAAGAPSSYGYSGFSTHQSLYPTVEPIYPSSAYPTLPSQPLREQTPGYAQSNASLSPLSSRLDTPQGSSPAAQAHYPNARDSVSYLNFSNGPDIRSKTSDSNSYMSLAHGTGGNNLAGTKRNHEQVGEFFGDVRRKRLAPTYDADMAERLNQTFGSAGIDDASLQALLSSLEAPTLLNDISPPHSQSSTALHVPETSLQGSSQCPSKLVSADAMKPSDLAQLNAFLLQLGANAARDVSTTNIAQSSSYGSTSPVAPSNEFDINALAEYGLTSIPGFDESLLSSTQVTPQYGYQQPTTTHLHRPIAQLPHRQQTAYSSTPGLYGNATPHPHDASLFNSHGVPAYTHAPQHTSFDSVRVSRGPAIVPQLAPMDMGGHSFRKVEALTRAAPSPVATFEPCESASARNAEDKAQVIDDDEMRDALSMEEPASSGSSFSDRYRSLSPAASSEGGAPSSIDSSVERFGSASPSLGLYPRLASGDALRRLPSLRSSSSSSPSSPRRGLSISSMLSSEPHEAESPPRRLPPIRRDSTSTEGSNPHYPSLADQISGIQGLGRPMSRGAFARKGSILESTRQQHVRLIRQLLLAINFPDKIRAVETEERITLPPILTRIPEGKRSVLEEGEKTPSHRNQISASFKSASDQSDSDSATTPPRRSRLPTISQLLHEVDVETHRRPRAMEDREMECDV